MKKLVYLFALIPQIYFAQCNLEDSKVAQQELMDEYANEATSPLKGDLFTNFEGLLFYPISDTYCVEVTFKRTKKEKPFPMKTTSTRTPMYVKYGEITFEIDGKKLKLDVFQNLDLVKSNPQYKNHLFLPFTDLTSGVTSYGGGRYLDLVIPNKKKFYIDFNKAYNPYCAYAPGYSCPLTPEQNDLDIEILAGVKYQN